jgi:hypothetical protein
MTTTTVTTVFLVTSQGAPAQVVTPVLAALDAAGLNLRAIDLGRAGARFDGAPTRVIRAVQHEFAERRLAKAWAQDPPDAAIAFDADSVSALCAVRNQATRSAPVIAVVHELSPGKAWAEVDADRFLVVDERAAADLAAVGVADDRVLVAGPLCEAAFVLAAKKTKREVRDKFGLAQNGRVLLCEVAGFGYELASQVALQLSLIENPPMCLFDAGNDVEAATALRAQVPTLDLRAKLFGSTEDRPLFWRAADVVVARPTPRAVARALTVGARLVALFDKEPARRVDMSEALEQRARGRGAETPLLLSAAVEACLRDGASELEPLQDGAQNVADVIRVVAKDRQRIIDEQGSAEHRQTRARVEDAVKTAEARTRMRQAAGGLEDLSGDGGVGAAAKDIDPRELSELKVKLGLRREQLERTIADAARSIEKWQARAEDARKTGGNDLARTAERNADMERARMHQALAELGEVDDELKALDAAAKAPPAPKPPPREKAAPKTHAHAPKRPVDDLLNDMKRAEKKRGQADIDAELKRLKDQMQKGRKP